MNKLDGEQIKVDGITVTVNASHELQSAAGASSYVTVAVNFGLSPYAVLPITGIIEYLVDCTGGNVIMTFPTAVGNTAEYGIKKIDATANTITLTPAGAETIDGQATQTIRFRWTEIDLFSDNANLYIK